VGGRGGGGIGGIDADGCSGGGAADGATLPGVGGAATDAGADGAADAGADIVRRTDRATTLCGARRPRRFGRLDST
jgi:hypothetical protein